MPIHESRVMERVDGVTPRALDGEPTVILKRARLLERDDRLLVELALQGRLSRRKLGEVFHVPAGTVTRRLQRIAARLYDPLVVDLLDDTCPIAPEYRQIGVEHFLQRLSIATIAGKHCMRLADVRAAIHFIRGWHRGIRAQREWTRVGRR
ncbi:MAG TPA: hypothetical protein VGN72_15795 [Tepidisphaeraceae bacterium]|jgi:hypothetical protein|nr:hypothetical protein [Tepidisphaeraceae bacterium]